jgi:small subunit ribosomal protein S9
LSEEPKSEDDAVEPTDAEGGEPIEPPVEEAPEGDAPSEDDASAGDAPAEDEAPAEEDASAEGEVPAEGEAPAEEDATEATAPVEVPPGEPAKKRPEVVPGAELEPIALEPEVELDAEERARLEAEAEEEARREAELEEVDRPLEIKLAKLHPDSRYTATGKRKSSIARVILSAGEGAIVVNSRKLEDYFPRSYLQSVARQPLVQTGYDESVDVRVRVHGGGVSGQASAVRHGIARALCDVDPELRRELKKRGMLTRDARIKERRKAGLKKARKRPQFSKR